MLVTWVAGGHQMVGNIEKVEDGFATVSRLTNSGLRPDMRLLPLDKLREANPIGPEAEAFSAQVKLQQQQAAWLAYHDKQFNTTASETYPDSSYAKEFPLTSEADLMVGNVNVVKNWLVQSFGYVFVSAIINRFGKTVEVYGYEVVPLNNWLFITRSLKDGKLPIFGTVVKSQDDKPFVIKSRSILKISSQFSVGEYAIFKRTGEKVLITGCDFRRREKILYSVEGSDVRVSGFDLERIDFEGDRLVFAS